MSEMRVFLAMVVTSDARDAQARPALAVTLRDGQITPWHNEPDANGVRPVAMSHGRTSVLLDYLMRANLSGCDLYGWDTTRTAMRVMSRLPGRYDEVRQLALDHYDPVFGVVCYKGHALRLDAAAAGLGVFDSLPAVRLRDIKKMWFDKHAHVQERALGYLCQYVKAVRGVCLAAEKQGVFGWVNRQAKFSGWRLPVGMLPTVDEARKAPQARGGRNTDRAEFIGWMNGVTGEQQQLW